MNEDVFWKLGTYFPIKRAIYTIKRNNSVQFLKNYAPLFQFRCSSLSSRFSRAWHLNAVLLFPFPTSVSKGFLRDKTWYCFLKGQHCWFLLCYFHVIPSHFDYYTPTLTKSGLYCFSSALLSVLPSVRNQHFQLHFSPQPYITGTYCALARGPTHPLLNSGLSVIHFLI